MTNKNYKELRNEVEAAIGAYVLEQWRDYQDHESRADIIIENWLYIGEKEVQLLLADLEDAINDDLSDDGLDVKQIKSLLEKIYCVGVEDKEI